MPRRFAPRNDSGDVLALADTCPSSACHCEPVRTLAWQSVLPAEIPDMSVVLRANSQCFSYSPKVLLFVMYCRKEYGLPRRFAPRNDRGEASLPPLTRPRPLRTPRTKRPCPRAHVLPSACHCEPVRTLAWQSVFPAEIPDMSVVLRANSQCFSYSPKVLLFVMYCRRSADCHVASLLAMTCKNLPPVRTIPGHCRCTAEAPLHP